MFDFQDLFQWDRFIAPASTETTKRFNLFGPLEDCGMTPVGGH
jgi:hypothetical protein